MIRYWKYIFLLCKISNSLISQYCYYLKIRYIKLIIWKCVIFKSPDTWDEATLEIGGVCINVPGAQHVLSSELQLLSYLYLRLYDSELNGCWPSCRIMNIKEFIKLYHWELFILWLYVLSNHFYLFLLSINVKANTSIILQWSH